jgi:3-deoxy-D-manno-octulosonic-acid transferase
MIWLAASTHAGEDAIILEAHQLARTQIRGLRLILAPRHPKRAGEILQIAQGLGLSMIQRSHGGTLDDPGDVFLADTLGEMDIWYTASTSCFIAGSLVPKGGHTPFEPAAHGCALIHGPHVENFAEIYAALHDADAAIRVDSADTLAQAVINTIQAPQTARISRATAVLSQFHGHEEALKAIRDLVS